MASYDTINYAVRANKCVERKIIVDLLAYLRRVFDISSYRYVGFGSMWFVDFILIHKVLGINAMISIESDASRADRVAFNRPYNCIKVEMGFSADVLPTLDWSRGGHIAWLDYDDGLSSSWLQDSQYLAGKLTSGSMIAITLNADYRQLEEEGKTSFADKEAVLRKYAGDLVPGDLKAKEVGAAAFPRLLADVLESHLSRAPRVAGRDELEFFRLFSFQYRDGSPMISVGGILVNSEDRARLDSLRLFDRFPLLKEAPFVIDVPPLTAREKLTLDKFLPVPSKMTAKTLGFTLKDTQMEAYKQLYRFYPDFREVVL